MKKTFMISWMLLAVSMSVLAQEVDKATVQAQANAAEAAGSSLKKVDTGDKAWKFSGSVGLNAAATGLWNWAAGGNNNVNGVVYGRFRLLYHENNIAWDTNLDMEYGLSWIDQKYDPFQKSSDKLNFQTKFGWEFKQQWYLTVLGGFQSQFAYGRTYGGDNGYDPIISKFLAPAYTDLSVGIDWKPNDIFSVYLSPLAGRLTTVCVSDKLNNKYEEQQGLRDQLLDKYGVAYYSHGEKLYDRNTRAEFGLSFKGNVNYTWKDLKIQTALGLFTPYAWNKTVVEGQTTPGGKPVYEDNNRRFGNFDVDWTVAVGYQFLKCLQVTLSTDLRYYNGVMIADRNGENPAERVQFKGIIGLGVGYSF